MLAVVLVGVGWVLLFSALVFDLEPIVWLASLSAMLLGVLLLGGKSFVDSRNSGVSWPAAAWQAVKDALKLLVDFVP